MDGSVSRGCGDGVREQIQTGVIPIRLKAENWVSAKARR